MANRQKEYNQTARDIVSVFFVKKSVFVLVFFGVIISALALSLLSPPIYEASVQLIVKPSISKPVIFDQQESRTEYSNAQVPEQALNTVIFLLTAPDVLKEVVIKHKLTSSEDEKDILDAVDALRGHIKAEPQTMSNVIRVSLRGRDPQTVADQLDTLIDSYIRYYIRVNQSTEGRLKFFDEQTEYFRVRYDQLTKQLGATGKQMEVIDPGSQKTSSQDMIRDMEGSRTQLDQQYENLRSKIESFESTLNRFKHDGRLPGLPADVVATYPALVEMERSLAQLSINRQRAQSDYMPSSKQVQDAVSQVTNMQNLIRNNMEQIITDIKGQMASNRRSIQELQTRIDEVRRKSVNMAADLLELDRMALEHKLVKDNYALYSAKREEARINDEKDKARFANVTMANRPSVPSSAAFPRPGLIMMLAIPLGFVLALAMSAVSYAMEQRLWTPTDLALHTNLKLLGAFDAVGIVDQTVFRNPFARSPQLQKAS
ncbi:MAG: Wzz/FepE/Etk N-terminal domain-containing protein [Betaproteobacteria bacterium]